MNHYDMAQFLKKHHPFLILCISITLILYVVILLNHSSVPFSSSTYRDSAYHFKEDPQAHGKPFHFLTSLAQYDAQWYLKIATLGYPKKPDHISKDIVPEDRMTFAFFPLYPLLLYLTNFLFLNIELSAFLLTNLFLLLNYISLYYVLSKLSTRSIALKTTILLTVFPFSIFLRSYYAENLQLFLLIWFSFFLIRKRLGYAALALSLLLITKGSLLPLVALYGYFLWKPYTQKTYSLLQIIGLFILIFLPFSIWMGMNYEYSGNPIYFLTLQYLWTGKSSFLPSILSNLEVISQFARIPLHNFANSQLEVLTVCASLLLLIKSKKTLPKELWWISLIIFITPLVTKNLMSYSRYQSISFPLFLYVSSVLPNKYFIALCIFFYLALLITSIYFVNWYWVG